MDSLHNDSRSGSRGSRHSRHDGSGDSSGRSRGIVGGVVIGATSLHLLLSRRRERWQTLRCTVEVVGQSVHQRHGRIVTEVFEDLLRIFHVVDVVDVVDNY